MAVVLRYALASWSSKVLRHHHSALACRLGLHSGAAPSGPLGWSRSSALVTASGACTRTASIVQARCKSAVAGAESAGDDGGATGGGGGATSGVVVPFLLSDIGEGIVEVAVKEWFVGVGDRLAQFDNVCEVQSDKASVTITSRYDGTVVRLHYSVDDMAPVGQPLIDIRLDQPPPSTAPATAPSPAPATVHSPDDCVATGGGGVAFGEGSQKTTEGQVTGAEIAAAAAGGGGAGGGGGERVRVLTTPAVRRLASENSVALASVVGTGRDGRILKEDVLRHLGLIGGDGGADAAITAGTHSSAAAAAAAGVAGGAAAFHSPPVAVTGDRPVTLSVTSRAMFRAMTHALSIPHFGYSDEYDLSRLTDMRDALNRQLLPPSSSSSPPPLSPLTPASASADRQPTSSAAAAPPLRLSYLPFVLKACSLAMLQYPSINAWLLDNQQQQQQQQQQQEQHQLVYKHSHDLGVAMDTPAGLLVPCIRHVQQLTILQLAEQLRQLQLLAVAGKLTPAQLAPPPTFTISNIGSVGGTYAAPVIVPPQVAIVAVGRARLEPRYSRRGQLAPAHIACFSWSADHRVVDGATLARFSNTVKHYLETPAAMLLHLK